jgi:hypothetical protein
MSEEVDKVILYSLLKKLVTPIKKTEAFKKGLIDINGTMIKSPETDDEKEAYTVLDQFIFRLRDLMGAKLAKLYKFLYLANYDDSLIKKLVVKGDVTHRQEIKRIEKEISKFTEQ